MANRDVTTRAGKGAAIDATENDQNLASLAGTVEAVSGTTHTVVYTDQCKTLDLTNAGTKTITLTAIATILSQIDTDSFHVTIRNTGAGTATINRSSTDTIEGATSRSLAAGEEITLEPDSAGSNWTVKAHGGKALRVSGSVTAGSVVSTTAAHTSTSAALSTLTQSGSPAQLAINDEDGNLNPFINFQTLSGNNAGALLINVNSDALGYCTLYRRDASGNTMGQVVLYETGPVALQTANNGNINFNPNGTGQVLVSGAAVQHLGRYSAALTVNPLTIGSKSAAHGLGATPDGVDWYLECITIDGGFAVGDRIKPNAYQTVTDISEGFTLQWDATNVYLNTTGSIKVVSDLGTNMTLTVSRWKIVFHAWLYS